VAAANRNVIGRNTSRHLFSLFMSEIAKLLACLPLLAAVPAVAGEGPVTVELFT
jgi:hypothetical protein